MCETKTTMCAKACYGHISICNVHRRTHMHISNNHMLSSFTIVTFSKYNNMPYGYLKSTKILLTFRLTSIAAKFFGDSDKNETFFFHIYYLLGKKRNTKLDINERRTLVYRYTFDGSRYQ